MVVLSGFRRFVCHDTERVAPRIDRTTRIPSGVASPVTTKHAAKGSVFVNLKNGQSAISQQDSQSDKTAS